ncbi:MAG TPA: helix-hairpin-helix domain-containing protein, partial [Burkholderiaceae bacterium]|nr:helix-hairpin-helix domain-containing protein [Burkholderiaceae bacterium]
MRPGPKVKPVDINSASRAELMKLPGIGGDEADRIIKGRPYPSKAKLLASQILSPEKYDGLKGRIVARQPAPAKPKSAPRTSGKS